jgi:ribosome biogenesis GTPase
MPARFPVKKSGRHGPAAPLSGAAPAGAATAAAGTASRARVIAAHGHMLHVRLEHGGEAVARAMGRKLQVVCGDYVRCEFDARHGELRIVALEPRAGALYRSNAHGSGELIAANLSLLLVVVAPLPAPDFYIVDRYLAAAQCAGIGARVVLNKCELGIDAITAAELRDYAALGLEPLRISAQEASGLHELRALLHEQTAAMVGQSGVGKSSLLRALVPDSEAVIGTLMRDQAGRHTTSASWLYALPEGGALIDSPGVRDFAPAIDRLDDADLGFTDIAALSMDCRFGDCRHLREPGCAVRAGVGGALSARRYESYRRLRRLWERLRQPSG